MVWHLIIICVAGFIGGFIGSQVGAGAIITLPALLIAGLPLPLAIGTNTLSGWLINVAAAVKYHRAGKVNLEFILPLSVVAALGAYIGAKLLFIVQVAVLSKLFAAIFLVLGIAMLLKPKKQKDRNVQALGGWRLWLGLLLAFVLGLYGGILSVGLATFAILAFNLFLKQPQLEAIANAVVLSAILLTASTFYFVYYSKIYYPDAIPLAVTSIVGSYLGAKVALGKGTAYFRWLLMAVLVVVIVKLLAGK